jgi:hypothetical protein
MTVHKSSTNVPSGLEHTSGRNIPWENVEYEESRETGGRLRLLGELLLVFFSPDVCMNR